MVLKNIFMSSLGPCRKQEISALAIERGTVEISKPQGIIWGKVKVVPYTFVRRGASVRTDTYPEPSACEVG